MSPGLDPLPPRARRKHESGGFSLIEVTMALGIIAFAFTGLFGLLPAGLSTFRQSINAAVGGQIMAHVMSDAAQSDFDVLVTDSTSTAIPPSSSGCKALRYFDAQGDELQVSQIAHAIYTVNTRIAPATTLPTTSTGANGSNIDLATVTVQVAANPANYSLKVGSNNLWTGALTSGSGAVPVLTQASYVARNSTGTTP